MFVADSDSGQTEFLCQNTSGKSLRELLDEAVQNNHRVLSTMIDERGFFRPNVAVFFGSDQQLRLEKPDIEISADVTEISIFPALSGG